VKNPETEPFLRLYARAYLERNADLLLDHLVPVMFHFWYSRFPLVMDKHTYVKELKENFTELKETSKKFYGAIKLVIDDSELLKLHVISSYDEFLINIKLNEDRISGIAVETVHNRKLQDVEIIYYPESPEDMEIIYLLNYTGNGYIIMESRDEPDKIIDLIIKSGYRKESCLSFSLEQEFVSDLMAAGFIVMTTRMNIDKYNQLVVLPTHHTVRSVLKTDNVHISRRVRKFIPEYQLKYNCEFELIVNKCRTQYNSNWLTEPLIEMICKIREQNLENVKPVSFGVYRDGILRAGEFGILTKNIYTSYSGYHDENNSGKVQMILTAEYLKNNGFKYWDLGMSLPYKNDLGAKDLEFAEFLEIFRGKTGL